MIRNISVIIFSSHHRVASDIGYFFVNTDKVNRISVNASVIAVSCAARISLFCNLRYIGKAVGNKLFVKVTALWEIEITCYVIAFGTSAN